MENIDYKSDQLQLKSGASYRVRWDRRVKVRVVDCNGDPVTNCACLMTVGGKSIECRTDEEGWIRAETEPGQDIQLELADLHAARSWPGRSPRRCLDDCQRESARVNNRPRVRGYLPHERPSNPTLNPKSHHAPPFRPPTFSEALDLSPVTHVVQDRADGIPADGWASIFHIPDGELAQTSGASTAGPCVRCRRVRG